MWSFTGRFKNEINKYCQSFPKWPCVVLLTSHNPQVSAGSFDIWPLEQAAAASKTWNHDITRSSPSLCTRSFCSENHFTAPTFVSTSGLHGPHLGLFTCSHLQPALRCAFCQIDGGELSWWLCVPSLAPGNFTPNKFPMSPLQNYPLLVSFLLWVYEGLKGLSACEHGSAKHPQSHAF